MQTGVGQHAELRRRLLRQNSREVKAVCGCMLDRLKRESRTPKQGRTVWKAKLDPLEWVNSAVELQTVKGVGTQQVAVKKGELDRVLTWGGGIE
jgi:hypothetical protein